MKKIKVAVVGVGSIAQIVHLPLLKKMENIELVAVCDIDTAKITSIVDKFDIPRWYYVLDEMLKNEPLDAVFICTTSHHHYAMAYLCLNNGKHLFVEKPLALNYNDARKLAELADRKKLTIMVGMQNRFRDDVLTVNDFIKNDELGDIYYIKTGWLKKWSRSFTQGWMSKKDYSGGGVLIDLGSQLIDLALYLTALPKIKSVRMYDFTLSPGLDVEDAALAVIETQTGLTITIEVSWRMHLENDMIYTHIFGKKGSAYLNPLRIHKEMHGNLVNVTPMMTGQASRTDRYKQAYENELNHFVRVLEGREENRSSAADAAYVIRVLEALYESAHSGKEVRL